MSLFGSIQMASNTLRAMQIGLQVVGQNVANANTPGYIREEVIFNPAATQKYGSLRLGMGVEVSAVVQKIDRFLESRLRGAMSERAGAETQEQIWHELEWILGELSDTDLSTSLTGFFSSIHEVLNQPQSLGVRNLAALQGQRLAGDINRMSQRVLQVQQDLNKRVADSADVINSLTTEIQRLNVQIAATEGGSVSKSDAVGLRDQRAVALDKLAELVDIQVYEQPSGAVSVALNGSYLVFDGVRREVEVLVHGGERINSAVIQFKDTKEQLTAVNGQLAGLMIARDEILGGFLDQLDELAATLIFEFNKVFSSGQGTTGYQSLMSEHAVSNVNTPLNAAGLPFTPVNGSFQVLLYDRQTGLSKTTEIRVDLNGLDNDDTSLTSLAAALNAIEGVSATITADRRLQIASDSAEQEVAFANDNSGVLAALGLNTFFAGTTARDIAVSKVVANDPSKFAASSGGVGVDSQNAVALAAFIDRPLAARNGATLGVMYERLVENVTHGAAVSQAVAQGFRVFEETLLGQHLSITGVSLDEEAVRLVQYQRSYQASAKYIATLNELLQVLIAL